ncbi:MAG: hypothetical protein N3A38_13190 [Planctomycetota bacterium]|nr:hypothetical protein [Planctomycetota bacterium]
MAAVTDGQRSYYVIPEDQSHMPRGEFFEVVRAAVQGRGEAIPAGTAPVERRFRLY